MLAAITSESLDSGTEHFQPSNLQLTTIDVGNPATNVIPSKVTAAFNIRFNDLHTSKSLIKFLKQKFDSVGGKYEVKFKITGEAFLTPPGRLSDLLCDAIKKTTGLEPTLSTTGGTSDARFIKDFCPIAEFGLISQSMHKVDENAQISDIKQLTEIYRTLLNCYFPE